jgi:hypothetical protein
MPPKSRGRSTTRNQPKGPRSQSNASTKTEHSEHARHPNDQQNRRRSSSRHSTNSVKSNRSTHKPNREPTAEELERQEFHKNQQKLINEVISQMVEREMLKMLNNLHTKGKLDTAKCEKALREYKEIGAQIKEEWQYIRTVHVLILCVGEGVDLRYTFLYFPFPPLFFQYIILIALSSDQCWTVFHDWGLDSRKTLKFMISYIQ